MKKFTDTPKYVLAVGDSFTDRDWKSEAYPDVDCSFKKWPELLANKLNCDVLNLGRCGVGNEYIVNSAIDWILDHHENIRVVVAGFTEAWRFNLYGHHSINPIVHRFRSFKEHTLEGRDDLNEKELAPGLFARDFSPTENSTRPLCDHIINEFLDPEQFATAARIMFENFLSSAVRLQKICKQYDIPLVMTSLMNPINYGAFGHLTRPEKPHFTYEQLSRKFTQCQHFFSIDKKSFIGWPIYEPIGGKNINAEIYNNGLTMGPLDGHPNKKGHHYIAQTYYEHYFKHYVQK